MGRTKMLKVLEKRKKLWRHSPWVLAMSAFLFSQNSISLLFVKQNLSEITKRRTKSLWFTRRFANCGWPITKIVWFLIVYLNRLYVKFSEVDLEVTLR